MDTRTVGDATIVALPPRIDANTADGVQEELAALIAEGARAIVCDLAATAYISSAGLRALLATAQALQGAGGKIAMFGATEHVNEIMEISGFSDLLQLHETEQEALGAVS